MQGRTIVRSGRYNFGQVPVTRLCPGGVAAAEPTAVSTLYGPPVRCGRCQCCRSFGPSFGPVTESGALWSCSSCRHGLGLIEFENDDQVRAFVRSRSERRDLTKGQRAMALVMLF